MKENVGHIDRIARSILGPALVTLGYTKLRARDGRLSGILAMIAGALVTESAVTRVCPVSAALGLDSRSRDERSRDAVATSTRRAPSEDAYALPHDINTVARWHVRRP